jgi:ABC-type transport system involved in multi-copper enzyme maturation permease subunit
MKASTHAEVYRPFTGELRKHPLRPLTLAWSGIRLGLRKKLPAFLLFTPSLITALVGAIKVYLLYYLEPLKEDGSLAGMQMTVALQDLLGNVAANVVGFVKTSAYFALLAMTWFGAGMIADDRRMGANLLYFSRPLTRGGYLLGKLLGLMFFGLLTLGIPTFVIVSTAAFASPDWSFLRFESEVIWKTALYASTWILTVSTIVLALSSLVNRKTLALTLVFGTIIVLHGAADVAAELLDISQLKLLSLPYNFGVFADWLFDQDLSSDPDPTLSLIALGIFAGGGMLLLWRNVRKMEVVG